MAIPLANTCEGANINIVNIDKYKKIFLYIFLISTMLGSTIIPVYAADDYILKSGFVGAQGWNNNLVELQAGHNYYFTFENTDSVSLWSMMWNIWNYSTPPHSYDYNYTNGGFLWLVSHMTITIYEASGSQEISPSNILINTWTGALEMVNLTSGQQTYTFNPANFAGAAVSTHSNAIVAVAISPSISVWVNSTDTATFTQYEEGSVQDIIPALQLSQQARVGLIVQWNLKKGAVSEDILAPASISLSNPSTITSALAIEFGFSADAVGVAFFTFFLLGITIFMYTKEIEITPSIFTVISLVMIAIFGFLNILPYWFAVPFGLLCISLLGYSRATSNNVTL